MKQFVLFQILEKLISKPNIWRKVKVFLIVGFVGFLITGAFAIWAGIAAMSYVASSAVQVIQSPAVQSHVEDLKTELNGQTSFHAANCWAKAQHLLGVQPWLERPALENLADLKVACFSPESLPPGPPV